ncbi:GNAT family N-acetyltransferase [Paenibacillus sambharensis]|uniref:GNAT family N-acetyltransferase n=1 Tax=Paenibacillus sambharensis TaxID=1803190 RepID=A0A2W1LR56_9BACL|nr:GNAT family N-acetyltransferase [Paenibacillus sambharensis]PZD97325.1 GNAT family N-acetyltransferase [Paenibacillus sambharensis]
MITLRSIDKTNWQACIELKPKEGQEGFVASNLYSLAESHYHGYVCKGIYKAEEMVGFVMYGIDADDGNYWIGRFMIEGDRQGYGYGSEALQLVMEEIRQMKDRSAVLKLGYNPDNHAAGRLYAKAGFVEEGIAPWGEMVVSYTFTDL